MKLKSATIERISVFIKSLENENDNSRPPKIEIMFSQADEGTLILSGNDANNYRNCLQSIIFDVGNERISNKTIESVFQKTILSTLDIQEKRKEKSFEDKLSIAIRELCDTLSSAPIAFNVFYPVFGLAEESLPIQVGNVKFCVFDDSQLAKFSKLLLEYEGDKNEKKNRLYLWDEIMKSNIIGKPVGMIESIAFDVIAAKAQAIKDLILTIDIINFFSDLIPYEKGFIYLPGENDKVEIIVPIISQGDKPVFSYGWNIIGSPTPFSFQKLLETDKKRGLGFSNISTLLSKKINAIEERIIASIQWAGKATIRNRKEEAFLLYAIALESLILPEKNTVELGYRLRTRVAHLLAENLEQRKIISKNINALYETRSDIVHNGSYQVTDADLNLIRSYSKSCILKIINDSSIASKSDIVSFVQWFEDKILC
jgi:hypothetical protein